MHIVAPIVCLLVSAIAHAASIEEPQTYEPKVIPGNVPQARQALGYDKYERQPVESSKKPTRTVYPFGNNWEQFDTSDIHYNFGYKG